MKISEGAFWLKGKSDFNMFYCSKNDENQLISISIRKRTLLALQTLPDLFMGGSLGWILMYALKGKVG